MRHLRLFLFRRHLCDAVVGRGTLRTAQRTRRRFSSSSSHPSQLLRQQRLWGVAPGERMSSLQRSCWPVSVVTDRCCCWSPWRSLRISSLSSESDAQRSRMVLVAAAAAMVLLAKRDFPPTDNAACTNLSGAQRRTLVPARHSVRAPSRTWVKKSPERQNGRTASTSDGQKN